ncbi:MAG: 4-alpha-glucanotransferase [Phycisphaerales bacterium JB040]
MSEQGSRRRTSSDLRRLARACAVHTSYHSGLTGHTEASDETLVATLRSLGVGLRGPGDAPRALERVVRERAQRRVEPVVVAWAGASGAVTRATGELRLHTTRGGKARTAPGSVGVEIETEDGQTLVSRASLAGAKVVRRRDGLGHAAWFAKIPLLAPGQRLESGYHRVRLTHAGETFGARLIAAPRVSYQEPGRRLGLFCPTYAIRSRANLGVGNLADLERVGVWGAGHGAPVLGTLPLLSCFLSTKKPYTFSPYSPVSRLFFNELFLDPRECPGFLESERARRLMGTPSFVRRAKTLRADRGLVDYRRSYRLLRPVLDALAEAYFRGGGDRSPEFAGFLASTPRADEYARFMATCEHRGEPWGEWPQGMRSGRLTASSHDPASARTHLYCQFALRRRLHALSETLEARDGGLYLDLAVGAHPDGYDVWANQGLFMPGSSVGAPPDPTYTEGQDWGFPAMHPERAREEGYAYFIDSLRAQMSVAGSLRLDHVMALHRLFVVPRGHAARDGVYVGYRDEELFAIVSLESHRNRCRVFGENLGTVPPAIEKGLTRHKIGKMVIGQFSLRDDAKRAVNPIEPNCVASLNTHDMPPVARFFDGSDVDERVRLRVFSKDLAAGEKRWRKRCQAPLKSFLRRHGMLRKSGRVDHDELGHGLNRYLASSEAELVLVNLEDLWGETRMQNVPGTSTQHPNWRSKLKKSVEVLERDTRTGPRLAELSARRGRRAVKVTRPKRGG